jgi:hypothetical protein
MSQAANCPTYDLRSNREMTTLVCVKNSVRRRIRALQGNHKHYESNLAKTLRVQAESVDTNKTRFSSYSPRGIKVRNTHALDTTIETDQRRSLQVPNKSVILDTSNRMFSLGSKSVGLEGSAAAADSSAAVGCCLTFGITVLLLVV